jgi:autotransporter-associated beta strand protein
LNGGLVATGTGLLTLNGNVTAISAAKSRPAMIRGRLSLGSDSRTFDVGQGPGATDLIIDAVISGDAAQAGLTKAGAGTLRFEGNEPNTYTGTTKVDAGVLELKKSSGNAVPGNLLIGAGLGGADAGVVRLLAANQIINRAEVTVNSSGLLDLNNLSDTIGPLSMTGGSVTTGTGTLTLNGNVTATSIASRAATITGRFDIGTTARTITVTPGGFPNADLVIEGAISATPGLIKAGDGTLLMKGNNPHTVAVTVNAGTLRLDGQQPATTVHLNAGTLEATGTIQSITTGTSAPKTVRVGTPFAFGVLKVLGSVTFSDTTTFEVKVRGGSSPLPGVDFDQLTVAGQVNLNHATLSGKALNFVAPPVDTTFEFITGSLIGEFGNLPKNSERIFRIGTKFFQVDYAADGADLVYLG